MLSEAVTIAVIQTRRRFLMRPNASAIALTASPRKAIVDNRMTSSSLITTAHSKRSSYSTTTAAVPPWPVRSMSSVSGLKRSCSRPLTVTDFILRLPGVRSFSRTAPGALRCGMSTRAVSLPRPSSDLIEYETGPKHVGEFGH